MTDQLLNFAALARLSLSTPVSVKLRHRRGCMETITNHQVRLAARPAGMPKRADWSFTQEAAGEPRQGEFLVKVSHISLDPAMRGWMNEGKSYIRPVAIGEVMRAGGA